MVKLSSASRRGGPVFDDDGAGDVTVTCPNDRGHEAGRIGGHDPGNLPPSGQVSWRSTTRGRRSCWPRKRSGDICWMFVSRMRAAALRPVITVSSSSTRTRWARTGHCLKKDSASQAASAAADAFACRSGPHSRRGPQSDTPWLFQPDLRLWPADQRGRCSSRHRHRQDQRRSCALRRPPGAAAPMPALPDRPPDAAAPAVACPATSSVMITMLPAPTPPSPFRPSAVLLREPWRSLGATPQSSQIAPRQQPQRPIASP